MRLPLARRFPCGKGIQRGLCAVLLALAALIPARALSQDRAQAGDVDGVPPSTVEALSAGNPTVPPELRPRRTTTRPPAPSRKLSPDDLSVHIHVIQPGESLWSISQLYGVKLTQLMETNDLTRGKLLRPGETLAVTHRPGLYRKVRSGETLTSICRDYDVAMVDVLVHNSLSDADRLKPGTMLFLPGARARRSSNYFIWPVRAGRVSSTYGTRRHPLGGGTKFHYGIDIPAPTGRPIVAAQDGRVVLAERNGSLGLCVILQHADGYKTVYGHASRILVKVGMEIKQGETIALVGRTGQATGAHLHFEIHRNDRPMDPLPVLPSLKR
ncbi:M23 family metallopeptidase [bacterium]|nr:M23 family metallopeptidase [bacterium]